MAHPFPFQGSAGGSHMSGIVGTGVDHGDWAFADDIRSGAIRGERPRVPCEHAPDTGSHLLNFAIAGGEIICHVSHVAMSGRPAKSKGSGLRLDPGLPQVDLPPESCSPGTDTANAGR